MQGLRYKAYGDTTKGNVKTINQDSMYLKTGKYKKEPFVLAVVADGMGGVYEGEIASRSLTAAFSDWLTRDLESLLTLQSKDAETSLDELLVEDWDYIIRSVSAELSIYGRTKGYGPGECPGSTLCVLFIYKGEYYIANIGDSRVYRKRKNIKQLTQDHSWAEQAKEKGYSEDEIENDSRKNMVTRCVGSGIENMCEADYYMGSCQAGDIFLVCSDGLRRVIDNNSLERILGNSKDTKEKCYEAINLAMSLGEKDNITAIVVAVEKDEDGLYEEIEEATEKLIITNKEVNEIEQDNSGQI